MTSLVTDGDKSSSASTRSSRRPKKPAKKYNEDKVNEILGLLRDEGVDELDYIFDEVPYATWSDEWDEVVRRYENIMMKPDWLEAVKERIQAEKSSGSEEEMEVDDGSDSDFDVDEAKEEEHFQSDDDEYEYSSDEEDPNEALEKDPLVVELIRVNNGNRELLNKFQEDITTAQENLYDMAPNDEAKKWMAKLISSGISTKNLKKYAAWGVVGNNLAATLFGNKVGKVEIENAKQMEGGTDITIGSYSYRTFNTKNTRIHRVHTQSSSNKWAHIMCAYQKNDGKWLLFDSNGNYTRFQDEIEKFYEDKGGITLANFKPHRTEGDSTLQDNIFLYYNGRCASWTLWACMMLTTLDLTPVDCLAKDIKVKDIKDDMTLEQACGKRCGDVEQEKKDKEQAIIDYMERIGSISYGNPTGGLKEKRKNEARTLSTLIMCFWLRFQNIKDQLKLTPMQKQLMPEIEGLNTDACRKEMTALKDVFNEKVKYLHGLEPPKYTIDTSEEAQVQYETTRKAFKTQFEWQIYFGLRKLKTTEAKMQSIQDFKEKTKKRLDNMNGMYRSKNVNNWGRATSYEVRNRVTNIKVQRQKHTQVNIKMSRYSAMYPFVHEKKDVTYTFRVNVVHALLPNKPTWADAFKFIRDKIEEDWNNKWIHVKDQVDLKAMFGTQQEKHNMFVWDENSLGAAKPSYTDRNGDLLNYEDYANSADKEFPLFIEGNVVTYPILLNEPFPLEPLDFLFPVKKVKGKYPKNKKLYLHFDRLKYITTNNDGEIKADNYGRDEWYFKEKNMQYQSRLEEVNNHWYEIPGVMLEFNGAEIGMVGDWRDLSKRFNEKFFGYFLNKIQRIRSGEKNLIDTENNSKWVIYRQPYQKYTHGNGMPVLYKFTLKLIYHYYYDKVGVKAEVENVKSSIPDSFRWKKPWQGVAKAIQQLEEKLKIPDEERTGPYRARVDRIAERAGNYNPEDKKMAIIPLVKKIQERVRIPVMNHTTIYLYGEIKELQKWDSVWKKVGGTFNGNYYVFDSGNKFIEWNKGFGIPEEEEEGSSSPAKKRKRDVFKLFAKLKF